MQTEKGIEKINTYRELLLTLTIGRTERIFHKCKNGKYKNNLFMRYLKKREMLYIYDIRYNKEYFIKYDEKNSAYLNNIKMAIIEQKIYLEDL